MISNIVVLILKFITYVNHKKNTNIKDNIIHIINIHVK